MNEKVIYRSMYIDKVISLKDKKNYKSFDKNTNRKKYNIY